MSVCPNLKFITSRPSTPSIIRTRPPTNAAAAAAVKSIISNRVPSRAASAAAMANTARVAVAQMTSINDLAANFATCSRLVKEAAAAGAKMLFSPESFSFVAAEDGESLKIAETLDGPIMKQYCSLARDSVDDSGSARSKYRKIHPFDVDVPGGMVYKESSFTEAGEDIVALDTPVGRLGLTVCYDLRFPEIYEQLRFHHQAQVIAAAQAGKHNQKRESFGDSLIIDPWGTVVGRLPHRLSTGIAGAEIDFSLIEYIRTKMPVEKHRKPMDFWKGSSL